MTHQGTWDDLSKSSADFKEMLKRIKEVQGKRENAQELEIDTTKLENCETPTEVEIPTMEVEKEKSEVVLKWTSFRGKRDIVEKTEERSVRQRTVEDQKFFAPTAERLASSMRSSRLEMMRRASVRSQDSLYVDDEIDGPPCDVAGGEEEILTTGRLDGRVYRTYFRAGGGVFMLVTLCIILLLGQLATSSADFWLSYWTNIETVRRGLGIYPENNKEYQAVANNSFLNFFNLLDDHGLLSTNTAIYIYTFFIVSCIALTIIRSFLFMKICMHAGRALHDSMFANILQATMRFFNLNPSGKKKLANSNSHIASLSRLLTQSCIFYLAFLREILFSYRTL